jgi:hypothetical protein
MIITGRTINQLPTLSAITSASTLILQTGNTTFKANLLEFAKSPVFGSMYQDLIPVSSNTFTIGTSGNTLKSIYVGTGTIFIGPDGVLGLDDNGVIYSEHGLATTTIILGQVTSEGIQSTGVTLNIINNELYVRDISGTNINVNKQVVPTGGTTSQVLAKNSNDTYDFDWVNLQGIYITGATSNGGGLNIFQSATTSTLAFKTITSITPTHISISDLNGLLSISGTGLLSVTNNGLGAFVAQSGTSSTVALRSLSSQTPSNLNINASGDLILFSSKTFYDNASNGSGGGQQILQSSTIPNLLFRTLSSSTPDNLTLSTSGALILFSGKTFITGATNNGSGNQVYQSADTQTLSFRTLSSTTSALTINASGNHVLFNIRPKYYGSFQDTFTQSATTNNVGVPMLFRTTDFSNGISIVSGVSGYTHITFTSSGIYNMQFSSQFENIDNTEHNVYIWLRRQGVDLAGSSGYITIHRTQGPNIGAALPSWNYLLNVTSSTDYYEIFWSTDSASNVKMKYYPAGNPPPAAASVILSVVEV